MPVDRRSLLICLLPCPALAAEGPGSVTVEGFPFDRKARVGGVELRLNGTGVRAVAWFKGYTAALYLAAPATSAAAVAAQAGPKRLQMRMLHDVPSAEFVKAFHKGVQRNTTEADLPRLAERMQRFEALVQALGSVKKGDLVSLDYEPGRGMAFIVNGTLRGDPIPGDDFYGALLRSFVGDRPYDDKLKAGLLRGTS